MNCVDQDEKSNAFKTAICFSPKGKMFEFYQYFFNKCDFDMKIFNQILVEICEVNLLKNTDISWLVENGIFFSPFALDNLTISQLNYFVSLPKVNPLTLFQHHSIEYAQNKIDRAKIISDQVGDAVASLIMQYDDIPK